MNILVYAFRPEAVEHERARVWLSGAIEGDETFGLSDLVLSGFLRIVTHRRAFSPPATTDEAFDFVETLRGQPHAVIVNPGPRHWDIFSRLCRDVEARGNLVPDAYLAALAIESGSEFITTDRDFARFPGLRWRHPFAGSPGLGR